MQLILASNQSEAEPIPDELTNTLPSDDANEDKDETNGEFLFVHYHLVSYHHNHHDSPLQLLCVLHALFHYFVC